MASGFLFLVLSLVMVPSPGFCYRWGVDAKWFAFARRSDIVVDSSNRKLPTASDITVTVTGVRRGYSDK